MIRTSYCGKRAVDLLLASLAIAVLSPLILVTGVLVRILLGNPVLFRQKRAGLFGLPFTCLKFRTMKEARDSACNLRPDAERLTRLGSFLRSISLDELPELFNVFRGDMSLVGPRPLFIEYLELYTSEQARRHEVKPGITGLAQVNGRNAIGWEKKFALDVWYVDHCSFWLDVKILALTIWKVFVREGVNQPGEATVEYFKGDSSGMST
jgi:lipopolysaccharide/colanic/teichoic acid biosynthesis glycosyltransferase